MSDQHKISDYIENLPLKKSFGMGFRPDDVYEVICDLTAMYNKVLSEAYQESEELRQVSVPSVGVDRLLPKAEPTPLAASQPLPKAEPTPAAVESSLPKMDPPAADIPAGHPAEEPRSILKIPESEGSLVNDKELQHLRRGELLEILLEQSKENRVLKERISELNDHITELENKLNDRHIKIEKAGTLAEASFMINGVLESAQAAAQQYLDNLQSLYDREEVNCVKKEAEAEAYAQKLLSDATKQCESMTRAAEDRCAAMTHVAQERCNALREETEAQCAELEAGTKIKCETREREAEERCAYLERKAKLDVEVHWQKLTSRLEEFYRAHHGLRELLEATGQVIKE